MGADPLMILPYDNVFGEEYRHYRAGLSQAADPLIERDTAMSRYAELGYPIYEGMPVYPGLPEVVLTPPPPRTHCQRRLLIR